MDSTDLYNKCNRWMVSAGFASLVRCDVKGCRLLGQKRGSSGKTLLYGVPRTGLCTRAVPWVLNVHQALSLLEEWELAVRPVLYASP